MSPAASIASRVVGVVVTEDAEDSAISATIRELSSDLQDSSGVDCCDDSGL